MSIYHLKRHFEVLHRMGLQLPETIKEVVTRTYLLFSIADTKGESCHRDSRSVPLEAGLVEYEVGIGSGWG
jgi:hypothetical protein